MLDSLNQWLFDSSELTAHGFCLLWEPWLIWTYAVADCLIGVAYFTIPLALAVIAHKRRDLILRPLLWLFAAFILLCGTTHWLDVLTLWVPAYNLEALVKAATAVISIFTAVALWKLLPQAIALPSPAQYREANAALRASQERLSQAQKMEAVGQLTGGMAHDFNNLLTIVIGNAEALMESLPGDHELRSLAETAMEAAERGAELTSRLLAFARRQPLDPQPVDVNDLVSNMHDMLRRTLGQQVDIQMNRASGLWDALIDAPQLESALLNLSINARDAMPEGGTLTIETENVSFGPNDGIGSIDVKPGKYVMIAITDTGTGMRPEVLARVFEPFFTTKDVGKGSGLGLSMVFGFVTQSKGHIDIQSEVGTGTCIKLYLPKADTIAKSPTQKIVDLSIPRGCETILYVEDDEQVRKHVTAQLKSLGYKVINASNGFEAIGLLEQVEDYFDLLFTDIMMPGGMNGRQLADQAKMLRPSLPILFVSGFSADASAQRGTHLLSKPFRLGDMARKIRQVLDLAAPAKRAV